MRVTIERITIETDAADEAKQLAAQMREHATRLFSEAYQLEHIAAEFRQRPGKETLKRLQSAISNIA